MKTKIIGFFTLFSLSITLFTSCKEFSSSTTGWTYNDPDYGGFEYVDYYGQETGPGLILVEGGTFSMGRTEQDVMFEWNNIPRRVTVSSYYLDETEVRNVDYREYLYWLRRVFIDYPEVYKKALPDTLVWREKMAFNEPYVRLYLRHPSYQEYPVVGVDWLQATDYCAWRTDRVNEYILIREGILEKDPNQIGEMNFNTEAYLAGQYEGAVRGEGITDLDPNRDFRRVRMEDGIFLPRYRLPTEAEWEFAALGLVGNSVEERIYERRLYPWNGHHQRNPDKKLRGKFMANFVRGRGDYMGVAGALNDNADITAPVTSYWPNDYGLYCMAGNVNEWVMDVYRKLSFEVANEFRPFRGNVFKTQERDAEGRIVEKDSLGKVNWREVTYEESYDRRNYNNANNINFLDGDHQSTVYYGDDSKKVPDSLTTTNDMYNHGKWLGEGIAKSERGVGSTSLITDKTRVYKGGSWKDRAYWLSPGSRRYLKETHAHADLGFRCAMARVGSPTGY